MNSQELAFLFVIHGAIGSSWPQAHRVPPTPPGIPPSGTQMHLGLAQTHEREMLTVGNSVYVGNRCTIGCDGAINPNAPTANASGSVERPTI